MRWLACALILLAGCGSASETPVAEPAREAGVLFAYEVGNHLHRYGGRVFEDGRYELFSGEPDWETFEPFTPDQVEQIAAAVDKAESLPGEIKGGSDPIPPDTARATFTLRGREVVVDEYPQASPPELEAILELIARLRKKPPVASTWEVWTGSETVKLQVPCDMGDVAVLADLRDALFMPSPSATASRFPDPPSGTPLVRIEFADGETHAVAADDGEPGRADAVKAALAGTDWAKLPPRLC
ncbi:hypothetical protein OJ997_23495 [Solirubrobacter phytolaccae]|uniref:Lipoprotein n=1 Tax=Solirubrobacter phytolaccae TaxID=1404360 RepID=A0A9X3NFV5_9ACTN|nr:hypothetical protein [Solirubrobacter phytolaccae]MDA0183296.1 hypothetical protein [Solirubrobacter phytolaccae]